MPRPNTTALPAAPSKVSDPNNFVTLAAIFLEALPAYYTQYNAAVTYMNSQIPNIWNFGGLVQTNPTKPTVQTYTLPTGTGIGYVSGIDTLFAAMRTGSTQINSYGDFMDSTVAITGVVSSNSAQTAATLASPSPPTRATAQSTFNTNFPNFVSSYRTSTIAVNTLLTYINTACFGNDDCGALTDATISVTVDAGALTDATITA